MNLATTSGVGEPTWLMLVMACSRRRKSISFTDCRLSNIEKVWLSRS
jgi:hypothetical protein